MCCIGQLKGIAEFHFSGAADGGCERCWLIFEELYDCGDRTNKGKAHLDACQVVSREIEHPYKVGPDRFTLQQVATDASVGGEESPAAPANRRKPHGVGGTGCEVVEMAFPADSVVLDRADDMPIAAVILVEEEDEG
jgi:hypothetical protein